MRELNDPELLAQCGRIKEMVRRVAENPKYKNDYYAKNYHHWKLSPPATLEEIERFEERAAVELPIEYVYYLTQVGRGGACPGTFFRDFDANQKIYRRIDQVSQQLTKVLTESEWETLFGCDWEGDRRLGTLNLCGMDLTYVAYLIVTGPQRGRVVYLDYDDDMAPMWPKASPDFLTWCENFYSELLSGYQISPTWRFMWQEPGDEGALIQAFQQASDVEYRKEVLFSFDKFPRLSSETVEFLQGITDPEYQDAIAELLSPKSFSDSRSLREQESQKNVSPEEYKNELGNF